MAVERAQNVVHRLAGERQAFVPWVRGVPEDQWPNMAEGGIWQARDYVAHLASFDPLMTALMRILQSGGETGRGPDGAFSIDEWNEGRIIERRDRSIEGLLAELETHRSGLNEAIADFTDEQLDRTFRFSGDKSRSPRDLQVGQFLAALVHHDRWHMEDAKRALAGAAEQPFGDAAWDTMLKERA